MTSPVPDCAQIDEMLVDYAYGEIARASTRTVEDHLAQCSHCRASLQKMAQTRRAMSALAPEPAPEAGFESLLAYAEQASSRRLSTPSRPRPFRWLVPALSVGGLCAVLVLVVARPRDTRLTQVPQEIASNAKDTPLQGKPTERPSAPSRAAAPKEKAASPKKSLETSDKVMAPAAMEIANEGPEPMVQEAPAPSLKPDKKSGGAGAPFSRLFAGGSRAMPESTKGSSESLAAAKVDQTGPRSTPAVDDLWSSARTAALHHDHRVAIRLLGRFLAQSPDHAQAPEALLLLATEQDLNGDADGAVSTYHLFLDRFPHHARVTEAARARQALLIKLGRAPSAEKQVPVTSPAGH